MGVKVRGRESRWQCARLSCQEAKRDTKEWKLPLKKSCIFRERVPAALGPYWRVALGRCSLHAITAAAPGQLHLLRGVPEACAGGYLGAGRGTLQGQYFRSQGIGEVLQVARAWATLPQISREKSTNLNISILIGVRASGYKCSRNLCPENWLSVFLTLAFIVFVVWSQFYVRQRIVQE